MSLRDVVAMSAYFARQEVDKASMSHERAEETNPSAGYIGWLLWGGELSRFGLSPGQAVNRSVAVARPYLQMY
jgi:hypothetical protein